MSPRNRNLTPLHVSVDRETLRAIDRFVAEQERANPGVHCSRVQAARVLLMRGIAAGAGPAADSTER